MSRRRVIPRRALLQTGRPERFRSPPKSDRLGTGIGDRVRPESVIGLNRNPHSYNESVKLSFFAIKFFSNLFEYTLQESKDVRLT